MGGGGGATAARHISTLLDWFCSMYMRMYIEEGGMQGGAGECLCHKSPASEHTVCLSSITSLIPPPPTSHLQRKLLCPVCHFVLYSPFPRTETCDTDSSLGLVEKRVWGRECSSK